MLPGISLSDFFHFQTSLLVWASRIQQYGSGSDSGLVLLLLLLLLCVDLWPAEAASFIQRVILVTVHRIHLHRLVVVRQKTVLLPVGGFLQPENIIEIHRIIVYTDFTTNYYFQICLAFFKSQDILSSWSHSCWTTNDSNSFRKTRESYLTDYAKLLIRDWVLNCEIYEESLVGES